MRVSLVRVTGLSRILVTELMKEAAQPQQPQHMVKSRAGDFLLVLLHGSPVRCALCAPGKGLVASGCEINLHGPMLSLSSSQ